MFRDGLKCSVASADSVERMALVFDQPEPAESGDAGLGAVDVDRGRFRLVLALLLSFVPTAVIVIGGTTITVVLVVKWIASFWQ